MAQCKELVLSSMIRLQKNAWMIGIAIVMVEKMLMGSYVAAQAVLASNALSLYLGVSSFF
jgi:hypothetical protein